MQRAVMKISPAAQERIERTQFRPGNPGRRRGSRNVMTNSLRECIIEAADRLGSDGRGKDSVVGWLMTFAKRHPVPFSHLLAKVLPIEVLTPTEVEEKVYRSPEEMRQALRERGISPVMMRLLADRMAARLPTRPTPMRRTRHARNSPTLTVRQRLLSPPGTAHSARRTLRKQATGVKKGPASRRGLKSCGPSEGTTGWSPPAEWPRFARPCPFRAGLLHSYLDPGNALRAAIRHCVVRRSRSRAKSSAGS